MTSPFGEWLELRCSELPLAFICPGSVRRSGLVIDESGAEADLGKAAHDGLATLVETGRVEWAGVDELARRYGLAEAVELRSLLALGARIWTAVRAAFPRPTTELEIEYRDPSGTFVLRGHADVIAWAGTLVRIADWKTGRRDADHAEQLRGYATLALAVAGSPGASSAEAFVWWVRDGESERYRMTLDDARAWLARVRREIVEWDGRYRAGAHCARCPRNHECPAGLALIRRDVAAVADAGLAERLDAGDALAALGPDELVALLARADLAVDVGARVRGAIRAYVERHGDVIGAGKRLTLESAERRSLDMLAAWPVLIAAGFDDDDLADVVEMSIAAAERVVRRKAVRGKGAAAVRELDAALDAAGAVTTEATTRLVVKRQQ